MEISKLREFQSVKNALAELKLLTRSQNTELTYLKGLKRFCEEMGIENLDELVEEIKLGKKDANQVYKEFILKLAEKNLAPKTIAAWGSSVKKLFIANGINISKNIPIKVYNVHEDFIPSKEELRQALQDAPLRTKAIVTFLASSGLRASELLELRLKDIDFSKEPNKVNVSGITAKERKSRITFISREASQLLKSYLEKRKLMGHEINENSYVFVAKDGSKMTYQNLQFLVIRVLKKITKKEGKRYRIHLHSLRKFFKTQLIAAGVPGPIVDRLVGHARYLAREYELYTEDQLREWYKVGERNLILGLINV